MEKQLDLDSDKGIESALEQVKQDDATIREVIKRLAKRIRVLQEQLKDDTLKKRAATLKKRIKQTGELIEELKKREQVGRELRVDFMTLFWDDVLEYKESIFKREKHCCHIQCWCAEQEYIKLRFIKKKLNGFHQLLKKHSENCD